MTFWDLKAGVYDWVRALPPVRTLYTAELDNLQRLIPSIKFQRHLDLGSGTGSSLDIFSGSSQIVLSDLSQKMLEQARKKYPGLQAVRLNVEKGLPFRDEVFEFISAIGLFEYISDLTPVFAEIYRVAAPEAQFLFTSAPPRMGNYLRNLTVNRLYLRQGHEVSNLLQRSGWRTKGVRKTWLQEQWLCQKDGVKIKGLMKHYEYEENSGHGFGRGPGR